MPARLWLAGPTSGTCGKRVYFNLGYKEKSGGPQLGLWHEHPHPGPLARHPDLNDPCPPGSGGSTGAYRVPVGPQAPLQRLRGRLHNRPGAVEQVLAQFSTLTCEHDLFNTLA